MTRKLRMLILLLLTAVVASGSGPQQDLLKKLDESRVTMRFSYETQGEVKVITRGDITVNGKCYRMSSKGLQVYCDGTTRWTVDTEAKEVYIEKAGGNEDYLNMIAAYLNDVTCLKATEDSVSGVWTNPSDGTKINFAFSSIRTSPLTESISEFVFDAKSLDDTWVVTDLL